MRGGVCAGEALLAGSRVVDAFGCDVRTFVWKHQVRPSGRICELQRKLSSISVLK